MHKTLYIYPKSTYPSVSLVFFLVKSLVLNCNVYGPNVLLDRPKVVNKFYLQVLKTNELIFLHSSVINC